MFNSNIDLPPVATTEIFFCQAHQASEVRLEPKKPTDIFTYLGQNIEGDSFNSVEDLSEQSLGDDTATPATVSKLDPLTSKENCLDFSRGFPINIQSRLEEVNGNLLDREQLDLTVTDPPASLIVEEETSIHLGNGVELDRVEILSGSDSNLTGSENFAIATETESTVPESLTQTQEFEEIISPVSPLRVDFVLPESVEEIESQPTPLPEPLPETDLPTPLPEPIPEIDLPTPVPEPLPEIDLPTPLPEPLPETDLPTPLPEPLPETDLPTPLPEPFPEMNWRENSLESLDSTAQRYPFIVNPTDRLTFDLQSFRPFRDENYSTLDLRFAENNPLFNKVTFANFPKEDQLYWVLEGNRVVLETRGLQGGAVYQGRETMTELTQSILLQQQFWGLQAVWSLPHVLEDVIGAGENNNEFAVLAVAAQLTTPPGIPAGEVMINSGLNRDNNTTTPLVPNLGIASTHHPDGGGALFENLDPAVAPRFLQAFPTTNLKPLLNNGVSLRDGAIIPAENLAEAGIGFMNLDTGEGFDFSAPFTSDPGLKIGQPGGGMNLDLLNVIVNPVMTPREREVRYLNSLAWFSLGQTMVGDSTEIDSQESSDWYRFYFSAPHKRTSIEYDAQEIQATYRSIFSNPGVSFSVSFGADDKIDEIQFTHATLGLGLGFIFAGLENSHIDESLNEAHIALENGEGFADLNTVATPEQRRQINQRLNQNLLNTERATKLDQLSGNYTFPSTITPSTSNLVQVRTGLYKRRVDFLSQEISPFREVSNFFLDLELSNQDFGTLGFIGVLNPTEQPRNTPINQSSAVEVTLINPDGQQFVQQFSSLQNSVVPLMAGKAFDVAFDWLRIGQLVERDIEQQAFVGELYLPSIEVVTSGTNGNLNYGASLGTWLNLTPDSAGSVQNELGPKEPGLGVYFNGMTNWTSQEIKFDETNQPTAIETQGPFFNLDWNSATNRLNAFQVSAGYLFSHQGLSSGYSGVAALAYIPYAINGINPQNNNGEVLGIINSQLATGEGLTVNTNFEIGEDFFFDLKLTQKVIDTLSLGIYYQNFNTINLGLESRTNNSYYGFLLRYLTTDERVMFDAQLGHSANGFDARINSNLRFNF
ncbi:hypothetical protein [Laspinema palackyanum]|uniref:hypothetical protein n=1 Tax=Laspinema palackyanum TaxID=3231601 RepID=UPI00345CEAA1|nr:hypothetical protein [Laspinema sp. D2c]